MKSFDTIHLSVPDDCIDISKTLKNYSYGKRYNSETHEIIEKGLSEDRLNPNVKQNHFDIKIPGVSHITHIPDYNKFDIKFSSKILRGNYTDGITHSSIKDAISILEGAGVGDIYADQFLQNSIIRVCDNTYNIELDNGKIETYLDCLDLIITQGKKGKIQSYKNDNTKSKKFDSVVIGKTTNKLQKITIYNKIEEAIASAPSSVGNYNSFVQKEYGMKWDDFYDYFENRLRVELRVTNQEHLRKLYTNKKSPQKVTLEDILFSKKNAILQQWDSFVNEGLTAHTIKYFDMTHKERELYKLGSFSKAANWALLKDFVKMCDGDTDRVRDKIQKLYYTNDDGSYRKVSPSVMKDLVMFCGDYRRVKRLGLSPTEGWTEKYKEVRNKLAKVG